MSYFLLLLLLLLGCIRYDETSDLQVALGFSHLRSLKPAGFGSIWELRKGNAQGIQIVTFEGNSRIGDGQGEHCNITEMTFTTAVKFNDLSAILRLKFERRGHSRNTVGSLGLNLKSGYKTKVLFENYIANK